MKEGNQISHPRKSPGLTRVPSKGPMGAQEKGWKEVHTKAPHCDTAQPWDKQRALQVSRVGIRAHVKDPDSEWLWPSQQQHWMLRTHWGSLWNSEGTDPAKLSFTSEGSKRIESRCSYNNLHVDVHSNIIHNNHSGNNPNAHRWMNDLKKGGIIHIMEYYLAIKRNEIMILINVDANKRSRTQRSPIVWFYLKETSRISKSIKTD